MSTPQAAVRPSGFSLAVRDSSTMLRRNLLHARRYPSLTLNLLLTPIMLLLLFVYVFGDTMSAGIGGGDRSDYIAYLVPGLLLMTIGSTTIGTAVSVSNDMTEGIIARFRTMAIHRGSVLVGHVVGSVLQSVVSVVLVGAVGVAIGFRSTDATALEWLAAFGLLVLFATALTWIAVGMGLISPNAEAASNNAMPLIFLPLISSTFVPVDAMPGWFQPIAEYQPFTPAIETLRGLLLGTEIGNNGWLAVAWCVGLAALGYRWSTAKFNADPK
ncbi:MULTISPECIES: ABC transporter permease [Streptomyces]|uniref:Transport permease protein n=1 Tax=Streptomyces sviceus (strain ATCC 29083 / DSM 924 / JCM 4929 / NBRC 13980 / NCIMB 11184 / NRRL 5439 / UC 5370) TaxID=463191 RepID=B5HLD8_STRX2|nr:MULTISPECIES: ABC transporter permease [Streptomyces]EDY53643.1 ABC transporter integral membrane protein [Streptomyces sviceus ATCC 29083]MYT06603.1 ABC transporter permease [Streptomyces sp. SID5470]